MATDMSYLRPQFNKYLIISTRNNEMLTLDPSGGARVGRGPGCGEYDAPTQ